MTSIVLSLLLLFLFPDMDEGKRLLVMVGCSTVGILGVTLLTRPEPAERLLAFYRRVRPPGFWGPIARLGGEGEKEPVRLLQKRFLATLLAALSVFLLLFGLGKCLIDFHIISVLSLFLGLGLIPLWWRLGLRG